MMLNFRANPFCNKFAKCNKLSAYDLISFFMFEGYSKVITKAHGQDDTLHFLYGNEFILIVCHIMLVNGENKSRIEMKATVKVAKHDKDENVAGLVRLSLFIDGGKNAC